MKRVCLVLALLSFLLLPLHGLLAMLADRGVRITGTAYESIVTAAEFGHLVGPLAVLGCLFWLLLWGALALFKAG